MRRRRRGYYNTYNQRYDSSGILLAEFKFYNKTKKIINNNVLKRIENQLNKSKDDIYWTNIHFAKHNIGFKFMKKEIKENEYENFIDILEFSDAKFTVKQFNSTKYIMNKRIFLSFEPNSEQLEIISIIRNTCRIDNKKIDNQEINTWDDFVNVCIENQILNGYERTYFNDFHNHIKKLFDIKDEILERNTEQTITTGSSYNTNVYEILDVIEKRINKKNYRVSIICRYCTYRPEYFLQIIPEDSPEYIYTDKGKIYFKSNDKFIYLDDNLKEHKDGKLFINLNLFKLMKRNIDSILDKNQKVVTANIYRFYKDRALKYDDDDMNYSDEEFKIIEQYKKILSNGKRIKLNDVIITPNKIEILDQNFCMEYDEAFLNNTENIGRIKKIINNENVKFNFNELYERLLKISALNVISMDNTQEIEYKNFEETKFTINDLPITITKENKRIKINGVFCRIDDVHHILSRAICYNNCDDYNRYIKEVSHIGVEWKKMISNGIALQLSNPFHNIFLKTGDNSFEKMFLRFSLLWDATKRNTIYLMLNNTKYKIKYKGKFKRYFNLPQRIISMTTLQKELKECITDINDDTIIEIVENAIEEAKIIKSRGEELVINTVKEIGAKEEEAEIRGNKKLGYRFKGIKTNSDYFVDKTTLDVYKKTDGEWNRRCIVNAADKQRIFEDKLANRLVNVYNEPKRLKGYL